MISINVDTAVVLPLNSFPLLDNTDFKTIETELVYNSAGLVINWNFVTTAGVMTTNVITATTGGAFDITEPVADKGMYAIELPASGSAAGSNNDREGFGWFTGVATGILPWSSPLFQFRPAAVNNALTNGTDLLDVSVTQIDGNATATNSATLKLKQLDITNDSGSAAIIKATGGNGKGFDIAGEGSGPAMLLTGGLSSAGLSVTTAATDLNAVAILGGGVTKPAVYILNPYGPSVNIKSGTGDALQIEAASAGVRITSTGDYGVAIVQNTVVGGYGVFVESDKGVGVGVNAGNNGGLGYNALQITAGGNGSAAHLQAGGTGYGAYIASGDGAAACAVYLRSRAASGAGVGIKIHGSFIGEAVQIIGGSPGSGDNAGGQGITILAGTSYGAGAQSNAVTITSGGACGIALVAGTYGLYAQGDSAAVNLSGGYYSLQAWGPMTITAGNTGGTYHAITITGGTPDNGVQDGGDALHLVGGDHFGESATAGAGIHAISGDNGAGVLVSGDEGMTINGTYNGLTVNSEDGDGVYINSDTNNGVAVYGYQIGAYIFGTGIGMEVQSAQAEGVKIVSALDGIAIESGSNGVAINAATNSGVYVNSAGIAVELNAGTMGLYVNANEQALHINSGLTAIEITGAAGGVAVVAGGNNSAVLLSGAGTGHGLSCVKGGGTGSKDIDADELDILTGTIDELGVALPPKNPTISQAVMLGYMYQRNKITEDGSYVQIYNDAGAVITKGATSETGGLFTKDKLISG